MSRSFLAILAAVAAFTYSLFLAENALAADNTGKVVQFQNGGGYTYAEVEVTGGQKVWIAGSQIEVKKGTQVRWGNAMVMRNFDSKALNKRFAEILFVDGWGPVGKQSTATSPHGSYPTPQLGAAPPAAAGTPDGGVVKSVANAGGYSYIEVTKGSGTVWVAAMETPMKAGDKVQWQGGTEMSNFTAKSLNRTFPKIIFAQTVTVAK
ncbi:MAG: hypothetical protein HY854_19710 [Burkholderiales bacterium]|nr:hypothetical protein [Burkholderiales bacterium]